MSVAGRTSKGHTVATSGRTPAGRSPQRPHRIAMRRHALRHVAQCSCGWRSLAVAHEKDARDAGLRHLRGRSRARKKDQDQAVAARRAGYR